MDDMDEMGGMMTDDEMESLADLRGDEFDRTWLEMMTEHHQGAIAMAKTEIDEGANPGGCGSAAPAQPWNADSNADSSSGVASPLNPQPFTVPSVAVSR